METKSKSLDDSFCTGVTEQKAECQAESKQERTDRAHEQLRVAA
jgi:hypothetical protein